MSKITEKTYMNTSFRGQLKSRIKILGEDYLSEEVQENAINQLSFKDEFFCNLISTPHFSNEEIEAILEINI